MKLLYVGTIGIHSVPLLQVIINKKKYELQVVNVGYSGYEWGSNNEIKQHNIYKNSQISKIAFEGRGGWFKKSLYHKLFRNSYIRKIVKVVKNYGPDIIFSGWGRTPFPELHYVKKKVDEVPMVHDFGTYPVSMNRAAATIENKLNGEVISNIEGMILASKEMKNYMQNKFCINNTNSIIFSEYIPDSMFLDKDISSGRIDDNEAHLVFLGKRKRDLGDAIDEITSKAIHVHMAKPVLRSCSISDKCSYVHGFDMFSYNELESGEFSNFISKFDASILLYPDFDSPRFKNTLPERLIWSIAAGVPIVLPKSSLMTSERYVLKNDIGIVYDSLEDLNTKVNKTKILESKKDNLRENIDSYKLENNFYKIESMFESML